MSKHIAIVGSGQLARMMAQDGIPMGLRFTFLAEEGEDTRCVDNLGNVVFRPEEANAEELYNLLGKPDVVTVEKEHVDIELLTAMEKQCAVHPNPRALDKFKNRRVEKRFLESLNIPIAPFFEIREEADLREAFAQLNKPVFLKTEEEGYDGYNQFKLTEDNFEQTLKEIEFPGQWVAEGFIPFQREVSFLAARAENGEMEFYPAVENYHRNGTLLTSLAPAPEMSDEQVALGQKYIADMMNSLNYVGLMCMECFVWDGKILVNEIAPRVHNSGHWTSKGALTSQFENHVRAVSGLPLGSTQTSGISGMLNLLGVVLTAEQASEANSFLTLYGKTVRARRKLGHVTVNLDSVSAVKEKLSRLEDLAYRDE